MDSFIKQIGDRLIKGKWNTLTILIYMLIMIGPILLSSIFGVSALGIGNAISGYGGGGIEALFNTFGIMFLVILAIGILWILFVSRHNMLAIICGILFIINTIIVIIGSKSAMDQFGFGTYSTFASNQLLYASIPSIILDVLLIFSGVIGIKYKKMINNK